MGVSAHEVHNRAARRAKHVAKFYRGPKDTIGIKHTAKGAPHAHRRPKLYMNHTPSKDPSVTNHERVRSQRIRSGRLKVEA